jgi:hypothetical protein
MAAAGTPLGSRHPATQHAMMTLQPNPRLDGVALDIALKTWDLAVQMCLLLGDGTELSAGLRKLREAKDCLVIQGLIDSGAIAPVPDPPPRASGL